MELVSHIMDLQDSVFKLERAIVEPRNVNDCKAGALIPLVMESYAIYTMLTYFLTKMVESTYFPLFLPPLLSHKYLRGGQHGRDTILDRAILQSIHHFTRFLH